MRSRLSVSAASLALLVTAAPATAATVGYEPREYPADRGSTGVIAVLVVRGGAEADDVTVRQRRTGPATETTLDPFVIRDATAPLEPGARCRAIDAHTVECDWANSLEVHLGGGDDRAADVGMTRAGLVLDGGDGDDVLVGGAKEYASLDGGPGDDRLVAGTGNTLMEGGAGADRLEGGPGTDRMVGDPVSAPPAPDVLDGGSGGADSVTYEGRATPLLIDLETPGDDGAAGEGDAITGVELITGGLAGDVLRGDERPNRLLGGGGGAAGEVLVGRGGDDVLEGGDGGDLVLGGDGDDALFPGDGVDRVDGGAGDDGIGSGYRRSPTDPGDRITCGPGRDVVNELDARDVLARDCETMEAALLLVGPPRPRAGGGFTVSLTQPRVFEETGSCGAQVRVVTSRRTLRSRRFRPGWNRRIDVAVTGTDARRPSGLPPARGGHVRVLVTSDACGGSGATGLRFASGFSMPLS